MTHERSDEELLRAFCKGERDALGLLAQRHELALLGVAKGLLGTSEAAVDAVQETWMRVIRYGHSFNGRSSFKTWVYRIAVNRCRDLASRGRAGLTASPVSLESMPQRPGRDAPALAERDAELHAAVAGLPEKHREIILLCYHEGLTHEQAADVLELPVGTLKSRLHAALNDLRKRLGNEVGVT